MNDGDFSTGSMMMIPPSAKLFTDAQLLRRNLRKFGWSPVLVDISILSNILQEEDEEALALLRRHRDWETLHENMFDHPQTTTTTSDLSVVTYRCAESGSPGGSLVEPKQSLEMKRFTNGTVATDDEDSVHVRMKSWITILHAVARTVAQTLEWPDDTLIASNQKNADAVDLNDDDAPPMDLLRAFLYDAVTVPNHQTKNDVSSSVDHDDDDEVVVSMGSSPHTDWGSLTVVWQDGVGGLETYCRQHDRWVPVPASVVRHDDDDHHDDNNFLSLIIHIGDVTSLAIGGKHDDDGRFTTWPSPLHRVRSPTAGQRRRSLVYFCYPSPKVGSLHNLQHLLRSADFTDSDADAKVGLEHYSLLQNQSQDGQQQLSSAQQLYERILHQPLAEVFSDKWSQVQR
jgi:hypothetical protein